MDGHEARYKLQMIRVDEVDKERSLANQARPGLQPIDDDVILRYAADMERGDDFPPVTAYKVGERWVLVSGNHRIEAAGIVDFEEFPAYILDDPTEIQITALTYAGNRKHGLPTSNQTRMQQAAHLVAMGMTQDNAAREVGLPKHKVADAMRLARIDQRLAKLKVAGWQKIPTSYRRVLSTIRSDVTMRKVVDLIKRGGVDTQDLHAIVPSINKLNSEKAQTDYLKTYEASVHAKIAATAGGRAQLPRSAKQLQTALRSITRLDAGELTTNGTEIPKEMRDDLRMLVLEAAEKLPSFARALG